MFPLFHVKHLPAFGEIIIGVLNRAVDDNFKMDVNPGSHTGLTHSGYNLALCNFLTDLHIEFGVVSVTGLCAVIVSDYNRLAVTRLVISGKDNFAAVSCHNIVAVFSADVNSLVKLVARAVKSPAVSA